jgi:hypothetical protein
MLGIQQVVVLEGNDCRVDFKDSRSAGFEPPITELCVTQAWEPRHQVFLRQNPRCVGNDSRNDHVSGRKVRSGHMYEIFKHCQRDTFSHIYDWLPRRVPAATDSPSPFSIQTRVDRPADSIDAPQHFYEGMLCSIRVRMRSTSSAPPSARSCEGVRPRNIGRGVANQ